VIIGAWHIARIGNHWYDIAKQQLEKMIASGLMDAADCILVNLAGFHGYSVPDFLYGQKKIIIIGSSRFEEDVRPLLKALQEQAKQNPTAKMFFIHGKGATTGTFSPPNAVDYWREYMSHFAIDRWQESVVALEEHDISGVEWRPNKETLGIDKPGGHFTGGFFWMNAKYLSEVCPPLDKYVDEIWAQSCLRCGGPCKPEALIPHKRSALEFFIGHANPKVNCFHNFGYKTDLYHFCAHPHLYRKEKDKEEVMTKSLWQIYGQHQGKLSDKWISYLSRYEDLFASYQGEPISLLEIGVQNGGSVELWAKYFKKAIRIVGVDINPKCGELVFDDPRIRVVVGDATNEEVQNTIMGDFDIIIDDGSHYDADIIKGFSTWFKRLKPEGIYVVEDMHCCQASAPVNGVNRFVEIAKELAHNQQVVPQNIFSVEFLNSMVIVHKRLPEDCGLGSRFIAGQTSTIVDLKRLHGSTL